MSNLESVKNKLKFQNRNNITYHRKPIKEEIKFGDGAIHYKEFKLEECWNYKKDNFKRWVFCPIEKLRYYY